MGVINILYLQRHIVALVVGFNKFAMPQLKLSICYTKLKEKIDE